MSSYHLNG